MMPASLFAALLLSVVTPSVHEVELRSDSAKLAPLEVTLPRDERLAVVVSLTAPAVESEVEEFSIRADNQQAGYWKDRPGPNLSVTIQRLEADGKRTEVRTKIFASGSSKSLATHTSRLDLELLDSVEARRERVRRFVEPNSPGQTAAQVDAAVRYFESMYIANPPGKYEVTIAYRAQSGIFAGRTMERRLMVVVPEGPDSLDRM